MRIDYTEKITESVEYLRALEKTRPEKRSVADRLKMLRLLKSGQCQSRSEAAELLGYSERQLDRWFQSYRTTGLEELCRVGSPGGRKEKVTPEAWDALLERAKAGTITRLKDAQQFLKEEFGIEYKSISGLRRLFDRRGIGFKRHRRETSDPQEV